MNMSDFEYIQIGGGIFVACIGLAVLLIVIKMLMET